MRRAAGVQWLLVIALLASGCRGEGGSSAHGTGAPTPHRPPTAPPTAAPNGCPLPEPSLASVGAALTSTIIACQNGDGTSLWIRNRTSTVLAVTPAAGSIRLPVVRPPATTLAETLAQQVVPVRTFDDGSFLVPAQSEVTIVAGPRLLAAANVEVAYLVSGESLVARQMGAWVEKRLGPNQGPLGKLAACAESSFTFWRDLRDQTGTIPSTDQVIQAAVAVPGVCRSAVDAVQQLLREPEAPEKAVPVIVEVGRGLRSDIWNEQLRAVLRGLAEIVTHR